jgi:ketosteroid isomerase-like protein
MYSWLIGRMVRTGWAKLNRRDVRRLPYADTATLRFPGEHPLKAECGSKAAILMWFERLFTLLPTLRFRVNDVIIAGPPWNLRVCTRYVAEAHLEDGMFSYVAMQYARLSWGKIVEEVIYPDTQAIASYFEARRDA